jgi:hypothetical protein
MKKFQIIVLAEAVMFIALLQSCGSTVNQTLDCGTQYSVDSIAVLTATANNRFKLSTDSVASPSQSCEATFKLVYKWANAARVLTDTSQPPLYDLPGSFHVNTYNLSYPNDVNPTRSFGQTGYAWTVYFSDHYVGPTGPVKWFMDTYLNSNKLADSVQVEGTIWYYKVGS